MMSARFLVLFCGTTFAARPQVARVRHSAMLAKLEDIASALRKGSPESLIDLEQISADLASTIANPTEHLSDSDQQLIKDVIVIIRGSMYESMNSSHKEEQGELDNAAAAAQKCNQAMSAEMADTGSVGKLLTMAKGSQKTYDQKQIAVQAATTSLETASKNLTDHMDNAPAAPVASCTHLPKKLKKNWDVYFDENDFLKWYIDQRDAYQKKSDAFEDAEDALAKKKGELSNVERELRAKYCDFSLVFDGVCNTHDTCYGDELKSFGEIKVRVEALASGRQAAFTAGENAIAHLNFLIGESEAVTAVDVDTSKYQINVPDFPAKLDCQVTQPVWEDFLGSACSNHWQLAMNIHASDGHNFGYGAPEWYQGTSVGSDDAAFSADYLNASAWVETTGFVAIVRHQSGQCEAVKAWELTDKTKSLKQYFQNHNPGRMEVTGPEPYLETVEAGMLGAQEDPITGKKGGGLVFNWWYSNNGCRIATTKAHHSGTLSGINQNDDGTHGLGNELAGKTVFGRGSKAWWHDVANMQGNAHGGRVKVQGTDHGTSLKNGPVLGQYAVFISHVKADFPCQGVQLQSPH